MLLIRKAKLPQGPKGHNTLWLEKEQEEQCAPI